MDMGSTRVVGIEGSAGRGAGRRVLLALTLGSGLLAAACKPEVAAVTATAAAPAVTVATANVVARVVPRMVSATGTVMPWQELTVDAEASGLAVRDVRVKENDAVRAGDLLVRLDDRALAAQVAQQAAAVTEAEASLRSARQEAARGDALVAQKAMSQETAETRRTAILTNEAKRDQAVAALDQLKAQLDQTTVRAPADGIVSLEPIRIGTVTQAGTELVRIIRDGRLEAQVKVPERDLARLKAGQVATVTLPDGGTVEARVRDVAAKLDAATRLGIAYVELPPDTAARSGMFVTAVINTDSATAPVVAERALVWPDGHPSVFVVGDDNRAGLRRLAVAGHSGADVVVGEGVSVGERVVTAGAGFLHDGDAVEVRPALAAAAAAAAEVRR